MFSLLDQDGHILTRASLEGSVWVADFIFTRCNGQCPLMSQQMARLQDTFAQMPQVRCISFSVDPGYDSPAVLAAYAKRYGAHANRWDFLTEAGTTASSGGRRGNPVGEAGGMTSATSTIQQLAQQGFHVGVAEGASVREPITHSVKVVLVDQRGRIRGYYDAMDQEAMAHLGRDARRLSRGEVS